MESGSPGAGQSRAERIHSTLVFGFSDAVVTEY